MLGIGVLIHVVITGISLLFGESASLWAPSTPAVAMTGIIWLTVIAGCFFRALDVKAGGAVLARRFGAVHASDRTRHELENRLLNVVAELSIASTTSQPDVYVLRHETSINAFVVGNSSGRNVVVVTQAALEAFDRDELQAVIAHEFGHIANGDLPLNMRLLVVLGGLMAIDEVGRILVAKGPDRLIHPGVLVGYVLIAIGSISAFSGKLLRAAFTRQREYLADASAVQFTRNPSALASALSIVKEKQQEPTLHSRHVQELAHLCFQSRASARWYLRLFASHPPLQSRIDALDPHFALKQRKKRNTKDKHESEAPSIEELAQRPALSIQDSQHQEDGNSAGQAVGITGVLSADGLSDRILLILSDESSCLAALFAVFACKEPTRQQDYLNSLAFSFDQELADQVKEVLTVIPEELKKDQLGIINHVTECLKNSLHKDSRSRIIRKIEQLVSVSDDYDLISYATIQLVRRKLDVEFPIVKLVASDRHSIAQARKVKTFDAMGSEFALLLSLMVEASGASAAQLDDQFQRVLKCYTQASYPRRTANETGIVNELEAAFQTLYIQPKAIRQAFVQHCVEIMQQDGYIVPAERALLDLFAASLCCEELIAA